MPGLETICRLIDNKNVDRVRMCYYPSCSNDLALTDKNKMHRDNKILNVDASGLVDRIKTSKYLKDKPNISETFAEYGLKDTFVRVSINANDTRGQNPRMFFRRESY